ncbi:hypothetical protein BCR33DRAFT_745329 [Rhizoclosmatium globosum]|uniref:Uncharacterized protein n=1 Tax=Rhizoclosmatium globosum TaxID=329046 RepID=A0A1Y2B3B9_9FUNG|nr:hypothetical protein BCR33DRAFT_745329 [Rhizoclosmatium globosum]|eukprot:ORY29216.1 hypothetical protein BCR33DRAFT_745329 [Rhizoclosmatium globosum]
MSVEETTSPSHQVPYDRAFEALAVSKKLFAMAGIGGHAVVCYEALVSNHPSSPNFRGSSEFTSDNSVDSRFEWTRASASNISIDSHTTDSSDTTHYAVEYAVAIFVEGDNTVTSVIHRVSADSNVITMPNGDKVQLFESLDAMIKGNIRRLQWAAFLRQENALLVWADEITTIIPRLKEFTLDLFKILDFDNTFLVSHGDGPNTPKPHETIEVESESESDLVGNYFIDGDYWRLFYIIMIPIGMFMAQFFFQVVVGLIFNAFGPTKQLQENSVYYSATKPKRIHNSALPTITVQIPGVVDPTVKSVQRAITEYELQGGTVNIYINDDGMQNLSPDQALTKMKYYATNNIGWIARPPHKKDGFIRQGRFKKASNMNFCLDISLQVEQHLQTDPSQDPIRITDHFTTNKKAWGAGNVLMGELILIVDSDTRVPQDCFLDAAAELTQSPEVAILQHSSSPMIVIGNYWENGIAFFTICDGGFQEGVSLTFGDEINVGRNMPLVVPGWILSLITYVMRGLFYEDLDNYFLDPFQLWLCLVFVFTVFAILSTSIHYYRTSTFTFVGAMFELIAWLPFFFVFFGGLSFYCSMALLARMFNYNIQWGATAKEFAKTTFSIEFHNSLKQLWKMYIVFTILAVGLFVMAFVPPDEWKIMDVASILPFAVLWMKCKYLILFLNNIHSSPNNSNNPPGACNNQERHNTMHPTLHKQINRKRYKHNKGVQ